MSSNKKNEKKVSKLNKKAKKAGAKAARREVRRDLAELQMVRMGGGDDVDKIAKQLLSDFGEVTLMYALALYDPEHYRSRVPAKFLRDTGLYPGYQEFTVPFATAEETNGRFGILSMPRLGSLSSVNTYKTYMAASDAPGWSTDVWTDPTNWTPIDAGNDPRIDAESAVFSPHFDGGSFTVISTEEVGNTALTDPLRFTNASFAKDAGTGITIDVSENGSRINFPPSQSELQYRICTEQVIDVTTATPVYTASPFPTLSWGATNCEITSQLTGLNREVSTARDGKPVTFASMLTVRVPRIGGSVSAFVIGKAFTNTAFSNVNLTCRTQVCKSNINDSASPGLASDVRPVAMKFHLQWVGETLHDAGVVSAALVPRGPLTDHLLSTEPHDGFQPMRYETYSQLESDRLGTVVHSTKLKDGMIGRWLPRTEQDIQLLSVAESNQLATSPLAVAGRYTKSSGPVEAGDSAFLIYKIWFLMEYTTRSRIPEKKDMGRSYNDAISEAYNVWLAMGVSAVEPNGFHEFMERLMTRLSSLVLSGAEYAGKLAGKAVGGFVQASGLSPKVGIGPTGATIGLERANASGLLQRQQVMKQ